MSTDSSTSELRRILREHLDLLPPPPANASRVIRRGRRHRAARRAGLMGGAAAACVVVAVTVGLLGRGGDRDPDGGAGDLDFVARLSSAAPFDVSEGWRAFASPGTALYVGGREVLALAGLADLDGLDTTAAVTPFGLVFFDGPAPTLLDADGRSTSLYPGPLDDDPEFRPTAKFDATRPLVAFGVLEGGRASVVLYDAERGRRTASAPVPCTGADCREFVVDAVDHGVVFVRTADGTLLWDPRGDSWTSVAGPDTRIADVRNRVVLHTGPAPDLPAGWRAVRGEIDSLLSLDGAHVLGWSSTLGPTARGGAPVVLDRGPRDGRGAAWWAFDTDGSVLVAVGANDATFYDCTVPAGRCEELVTAPTAHGDPLFIGVDM